MAAKRLIQQRRGRGTLVFLRPRHRAIAKFSYSKLGNGAMKGEVVDIVSDVYHTAPIAVLKFEDKVVYVPAALGLYVGKKVEYLGKNVEVGNIMKLEDIPDGTEIFDIELRPGDGGKLLRASGTFARVMSHEDKGVIIQLPSKKFKLLSKDCKAIIVRVANSGRKLKPIVKAGKKYYMMKAKNKYWPRVRGVAMNAVNHPFGGKRARTGRKPKTVARNTPPGRKVGSIAARRTGRRKK